MTTDSAPALPKKKPEVDLDRTRERLTKLGLLHAAEMLGEQAAVAVKETLPPHRFLDRLLEAELQARDERRVRTSLRLSGLPPARRSRASTSPSSRVSSAAASRRSPRVRGSENARAS